MTVTRGLLVSTVMLLGTVLLVGAGGVAGLLVWLGLVCLAIAAPDLAMSIARNWTPRPKVWARRVAVVWHALDRR